MERNDKQKNFENLGAVEREREREREQHFTKTILQK